MLIQIALDGPAGSGKSTVAKLVAKALACDYIDTGAMYRAIALKFIETGLFERLDTENEKNPETTEPEVHAAHTKTAEHQGNTAASEQRPSLEIEIEALLDQTQLQVYTEKVVLDGQDVSEAIRSPEVTRRVSQVAAMSVVRRHLVGMQQIQARDRNVVMDGRDIGTVVLSETPFKFYLTASLEERARRRCLEFEARGFKADYATILEDIQHRDQVDSSREDSPLVMAEDAIEIDTTGKTIEQVVRKICDEVTRIRGGQIC
jgi:cytidylate kinase